VLNFLEFLETDDMSRKMELRDKVKLAKTFDLDPEKYTKTLKKLFEDLEQNYTTEHLMLGKKLTELNETRITKSYDDQVFNNFEETVNPKLVFCETQQQNILWTYFRKRTSSITMSGQVGRSIRILVIDETSGKYIGIMAIGSDFYQISARDTEIKKSYPNTQVSDYINYVANITCCVPLQPFGYNCNGGKLLLKLAFSKEIYEYWLNKYKQPLLILTTLGVNGKSVMYSRLKEVKLVGYTNGTKSGIHIPNEIINKCKTLFNHLELKNNRCGTVDMLNTLFNKTKISVDYNKHITKKSVYFGWVFKSKLDNNSPLSSDLKTVEQISEDWRVRWCDNRIKNVKANGTFKTEIELLSPADLKFKNIKIYKLPNTFKISDQVDHNPEEKHKRKVEKTPEKEQREQELLIAQRLTDEHILFLLKQKGLMTTEEASNELFQKFNVRVPRNDVSKLYLGEFLPSKAVISSEIYKTAMENKKKRVYNKPRPKSMIKNKTPSLSDGVLYQIMKLKKDTKTAEKVSEIFTYTDGPNTGKRLNRTGVQNIWNGKTLPSVVTPEYQELLDFKRSRKLTS
jgi:hypothetical protein